MLLKGANQFFHIIHQMLLEISALMGIFFFYGGIVKSHLSQIKDYISYQPPTQRE